MTTIKPKVIIYVRFENLVCQYDGSLIQYFEKIHNFDKTRKEKKLEQLRFPNIGDNYQEKERKHVVEIINSSEFWETVHPVPDAIKALQQMAGAGYQVRIVLTNLGEDYIQSTALKLKWIQTHLKHHCWFERLIFCDDKTLLQGDILVDFEPFPERGVCEPVWKHVVFDMPYNSSVEKKPRLKNWKNWRVEIHGLDKEIMVHDEKRPYYLHGSKDSRDIDKYYLFDSLPSQGECFSFCNGSGDEDRNLIVVNDGVIVQTLKGRPDECNNSLYSTYHLHDQLYRLPVTRKVTRIVPLKAISLLRKLIGYCSDSEWRKEIKDSLKSRTKTFEYRMKVFEKIDFEKCKNLTAEHLKKIAFQFGITLALMEGVEIYTKSDLSMMYPDLKLFLYRDEDFALKNVDILSKYKQKYFELMHSVQIIEDGMFIQMFFRDKIPQTPFHNQCNGIVIDTAHEICVAYPFDCTDVDIGTWKDKNIEYFTPSTKAIHDLILVTKIEGVIKLFGP